MFMYFGHAEIDARAAGIEPTTGGFGNRCSTGLSYTRKEKEKEKPPAPGLGGGGVLNARSRQQRHLPR
jgi:hypothetical protein